MAKRILWCMKCSGSTSTGRHKIYDSNPLNQGRPQYICDACKKEYDENQRARQCPETRDTRGGKIRCLRMKNHPSKHLFFNRGFPDFVEQTL